MAEGTVSVRVFTSRAQLPIENTTVAFTRPTGEGKYELVAVRITDESGLTGALRFDAPDASASRAPDGGTPFALLNLEAWHPDYAGVLVENVQVFAGAQTVQRIELVPLEEYPASYSGSTVFDLPRQDL